MAPTLNLNKSRTTDNLKFSTFNCFGLGAILPSISEAYWMNFSAYYFNNLLADHGNLIFLIAQIIEGIGILLGWLILAKFRQHQKLHIWLYIIGVIMIIFSFPLVFLPPLKSFSLILFFSIIFKIGSGLAIISQLTIIPKITSNRNRRRKLVQKITELGLAGTFVAMVSLTIFSEFVSFVWKYFVGVCTFVIIGSLCSVAYIYKLRDLINQERSIVHQQRDIGIITVQAPLIEMKFIKSIKFYVYGIILISSYIYLDIILTMYPYFIKNFHHITQFKYFAAIVILYLSAFVSSLIMKNAFVYSGIRSMMSLGLGCSMFSTLFFIFGFLQINFGLLIFLGTCFVGISKVIAINTSLNLINELIGRQIEGKQFVYAIYYTVEKLISGPILYSLINQVYSEKKLGQNLLHFSYIYLPFILYCFNWMLVMVDRTIKNFKNKTARIQIIQPKKQKIVSPDGNCKQIEEQNLSGQNKDPNEQNDKNQRSNEMTL